MKRTPFLRLAPLPMALILWLSSCSTPSPMSRIDANRAVFDSWPQDMQSAVFEGRVVVGMTPEMVRMSLGEPTRIEPRPGSTSNEETWTYPKSDGTSGSRPAGTSGGGSGGVGGGTGGRRRRGSGGGGGGSGLPASNATEQRQIVFQNGVVTRVN